MKKILLRLGVGLMTMVVVLVGSGGGALVEVQASTDLTKEGKEGVTVSVSSGTTQGTALDLAKLQPTVGGQTVGNWTELIPNVITIVFVVAAALTFAYLIMGAIKWITSGGEKAKVEEARNRITAAVIGLLILAAVWAIFQLVFSVAFGQNVTGIELPSLNKQ
jgi:hypothetical protein